VATIWTGGRLDPPGLACFSARSALGSFTLALSGQSYFRRVSPAEDAMAKLPNVTQRIQFIEASVAKLQGELEDAEGERKGSPLFVWPHASARRDGQFDSIGRKVKLMVAAGCALVAYVLTAETIGHLAAKEIGEIVGALVAVIVFLFSWANLHRKRRSRRAHRPF